MEKLLSLYIKNPSDTKLAAKVAAHAEKHPMSTCMLSPQEFGWLRSAQIHSAGSCLVKEA